MFILHGESGGFTPKIIDFFHFLSQANGLRIFFLLFAPGLEKKIKKKFFTLQYDFLNLKMIIPYGGEKERKKIPI